jgi:citrate lyase subunit alpha/citrate CoA-transferase
VGPTSHHLRRLGIYNVTTICGPGELIDVIITERGIAINPLRKDLIKATKNSSLPIRTIRDLKSDVESLTGGPPEKHARSKEPVAVVKWVDGTVLDTVWKVE